MSRWRINYGNGQVSEVFRSRTAARQALHDCRVRNEDYAGLFFLQFEDPETGDWFRARGLTEETAP